MARKILLADDSVTAQNMGRKILTDAGYDVLTVNNGSAALKRVAEHKPDLIVLDVYMPGYSGLEVCARLKDAPETSRIPILLTVGKLEPFKPEEAQRVHADAFIVKPFEASELLSALTRLEDRMVPQADGARFSTSVSGIERFSGDPAVKKDDDGEGESGWKSRLRFPSKKKKEEPEPEPDADFVTTPYREFKRGGGKTPASAPFPVNSAAAPTQEPGLVPDIPRDITPEELDALSELVAKLDGPIPAAENITALGEQIGPAESPAAPAEAPKVAEVVASTSDPVVEVKQEAEPVAAVAEVKSAAEPSETGAVVGDAASRVSTDNAVEPAAAIGEVVSVEAAAPPVFAVEAPVAEPAPEEPAPVDKNDEPAFATPASAESTPPMKEKPAVPVEVAPAPSANVEAATVESAPAVEEPKTSEEPPTVEAAKVEEIPQAVVEASAPKAAEAETPAPSPEELAEALRLLTPSQTGAASTLAEAGAALVEELGRGANGGSRWVAEAVALSPEEASLSLEAEMFRTFASAPASGSGNDGNGAKAAVGHAEEEAAEAAVEAAEAIAEVRVETASVATDESQAATATGMASAATEAETKDSHEKPVEAEQEVAATTFADAVRHEEAPASAEAVHAQAGSADQEEAPSSEDAAEDDMGKDGKKGGKSNWHQIRTGAPAAGAADAVEAAKQAEEAPKAMAAAASAEGASDASAIASIVDSVLADLRPKIVEEIAKKLAKK